MSTMSRLHVEVIDAGLDETWVYTWVASHGGTIADALLYIDPVTGVCECCGESMAGVAL